MVRPRVFKDRAQAGAALGLELQRRTLQPPVLVLGLPRGGVPVAYEVARVLDAPLDVMIVRKVGLPGEPELAIGAVASGNVVVHESHMAEELPHFAEIFAHAAESELRELQRREDAYRLGLGGLALRGTTAVLVDDGLATGSTMLAAMRAARQRGAARVIVAAPVASWDAVELVTGEADAVVILQVPPALFSIGAWYENFDQLEDAEVTRLLRLRQRHRSSSDASQHCRDAG